MLISPLRHCREGGMGRDEGGGEKWDGTAGERGGGRGEGVDGEE